MKTDRDCDFHPLALLCSTVLCCVLLGFRTLIFARRYNELGSLWTAYASRPNFGVTYDNGGVGELPDQQLQIPQLQADDDVEILHTMENQDAFVAYVLPSTSPPSPPFSMSGVRRPGRTRKKRPKYGKKCDRNTDRPVLCVCLNRYYADDYKGAHRRPEFERTLGLAMEPLKQGFTVNQLWDI